MTFKKRIAFFAAALAVSPVWVAAEGIPDFANLDRNRDGALTLAEARHFMDTRTLEADFNRSGKLDPKELSRAAAHMNERQAADYIELLDTDGDNQLDYDEIAQDLPMIFQAADLDSSGSLSSEEYAEAVARFGR